MFAVLRSGGKQYRVVVGDTLQVEWLKHDVGCQVQLSDVLMVTLDSGQVLCGAPCVKGAHVMATVVLHGRQKKVHIVKLRRRKHYQRHQGHRQCFTQLQVDGIHLPS